MIKKYLQYILGILAGVLILTFIYIKYCTINPSEIVLVITAVIIYWYTLETHGMRKEMIAQKEITTMPILVIRKRDFTFNFYIENIGNFPAYNIRIQELVLKEEVEHPEQILVFDLIDLLMPKDKIDVGVKKSTQVIQETEKDKSWNQLKYDHGRINIFNHGEEQNYELSKKETIITFENIAEEKYKATLEFMTEEDKIIIRRPKKIR